MASATLFTNGRFFTTDDSERKTAKFAQCMLVEDGIISYVGDDTQHAAQLAAAKGADVRDLNGDHVLPGFIDGHTHILLLGQTLKKLDLEHCKTLEDVRSAIRTYAKANPDLPRIICAGWMEYMTDGKATADMLDDLDPRPIFIDSRDLHSSWCNTPAMAEMNVQSMPDPVGGKIYRDANGNPSGLFSEAACVFLVWPHLAKVASPRDRVEAIRGAIAAMNAAGCTGFIDMAMDDISWDALLTLRAEEGGSLPVHIAAHWFIKPTDSPAADLAQVDKAIALHTQYNATTSPDLRIAGIKLMLDGVVDSCTAALLEPYTTGQASAPLAWSHDALGAVVQKADSANLQCALHAIGDAAVDLALTTLTLHARPTSRHRIEHLELTQPGDAARLAAAGVTASIQPAHADPVLLKAWPTLLGPDRYKRAFAYREFADAGANLALGSDAPTAPYRTLRNMYVATTRRSLREPHSGATANEHFALSLAEAVAGASLGSARSCFAEGRVGELARGLRGDFVVVRMRWDARELLAAGVRETWVAGRRVFAA